MAGALNRLQKMIVMGIQYIEDANDSPPELPAGHLVMSTGNPWVYFIGPVPLPRLHPYPQIWVVLGDTFRVPYVPPECAAGSLVLCAAGFYPWITASDHGSYLFSFPFNLFHGDSFSFPPVTFLYFISPIPFSLIFPCPFLPVPLYF
jgi:hypothetical protein